MSIENRPADDQFAHVPPAIPVQTASAITLLDEWLADESGYDEQAWPELKAAIDRDRESARRLFDG